VLRSISLEFTEPPTGLIIPAEGVTIFVGPNNSGKSLVLRELERKFSSDGDTSKLLSGYDVVWPDEAQLEKDLRVLSKDPSNMREDHTPVRRFDYKGNIDAAHVHNPTLRSQIAQKAIQWMSTQYFKYFVIRLDGRTRFDLTDDKEKGDLLSPARNLLVELFKNEPARKTLRDIIYDALKVYFTIDQLHESKLRIRLSPTPPGPAEQHWSEEARRFHGAATHIRDASDGVQAFVGIVMAVLSGDFRLILLDEPEAFLHPPLARKLGYELTSRLKADSSLMAATHSADFLTGCLQASTKVRVVRLEYSNGKSKGRIADSDVLTQLYRHPLMRSSNVLSALFYDGVVVTESDNDRVFYSEIYHRLAEKEKQYPSVLFLNAQNKTTTRDIIGPLRKLGVPAVALVDVDLLKIKGEDWSKMLSAAQVPDASHTGLGQQRGELNKRFADGGLDMHKGGIALLEDSDKRAANDFFDSLDQYGLAAVRIGELESWLAHLGVTGASGTEWTINMMERLGSDPSSPDYVQPADGDVWDFMRKIIKWIADPARKGTT
jgi:hypothetical protein